MTIPRLLLAHRVRSRDGKNCVTCWRRSYGQRSAISVTMGPPEHDAARGW